MKRVFIVVSVEKKAKKRQDRKKGKTKQYIPT